jgi:hypothetical protein
MGTVEDDVEMIMTTRTMINVNKRISKQQN